MMGESVKGRDGAPVREHSGRGPSSVIVSRHDGLPFSPVALSVELYTPLAGLARSPASEPPSGWGSVPCKSHSITLARDVNPRRQESSPADGTLDLPDPAAFGLTEANAAHAREVVASYEERTASRGRRPS
jgi:hypothetical protein